MTLRRYVVVDLDAPGIVRIAVARSEEVLERQGVLLVDEATTYAVAEVLAHAYFWRTQHWIGVVDRTNWELIYEVRPGREPPAR